MKSVAALALVAALTATTVPLDADAAFASSSFTGKSLSVTNPVSSSSSTISMEYIPSGMSKEQWRKLKDAEKKKDAGKNLGKVGITSFQSRTFAEWQKAGGKNLFPVDPNKVKSAKEIPYMQRAGGKPDDSDLGGKKGGKKGGGMFSFGNKKKEPEPEPAPAPPKKNWWTL